MAEELGKKVFELTGQGLSQRKVATTLGIKRSLVQRVLEKHGSTTANQPTNQPTTGQPGQPPGSNTSTTGQQGLPPGLEKAPVSLEGDRGKVEASEAVERELWLKATPIVRKIILNPKMFFWYDYAVGQGFKGDIGDFLEQAVEDFWKARGYKVVVEKTEEVE